MIASDKEHIQRCILLLRSPPKKKKRFEDEKLQHPLDQGSSQTGGELVIAN